MTVDPAFNGLRIGNTPIQRLWTGALWSEGPAWSSQGRYLVWSDIPNDRQLRWLEDDGRVTVFRAPSNNSNGNTFDFAGRQVSCEHLLRRVVRYEHDGTVTIVADAFDGKPLNSPNDVVPHPDGSYWFTDPPFGGQLYEGVPDAPGGPSNAQGLLRQRVGQAAGVGEAQRELPTNVYRVAPNGRVTLAIAADLLPGPPNGLAFSADHTKLYVVSAGNLHVGDVAADGRVSRRQAIPRHDDRRRELPHRRHPRRRPRQPLVLEQRRAQRRLQRRDRLEFGRRPARPHPARRRSAPTSRSADRSATGCSWPRASRCTLSTSTRRAPRPAEL